MHEPAAGFIVASHSTDRTLPVQAQDWDERLYIKSPDSKIQTSFARVCAEPELLDIRKKATWIILYLCDCGYKIQFDVTKRHQSKYLAGRRCHHLDSPHHVIQREPAATAGASSEPVAAPELPAPVPSPDVTYQSFSRDKARDAVKKCAVELEQWQSTLDVNGQDGDGQVLKGIVDAQKQSSLLALCWDGPKIVGVGIWVRCGVGHLRNTTRQNLRASFGITSSLANGMDLDSRSRIAQRCTR